MKYIKIFILLFIIFIVTGCSVNYELSFYDNEFKENISFSLENNVNNIELIEVLKSSEQYVHYISSEDLTKINYKKKFEEKNNKTLFNYSYNYSKDFGNSRPLRECFDAYSFIEEDNYYIIQTGKKFNCLVYDYMIADEIKITFKTDHKVIENNADKIVDNEYTWIINKDNFKDKPITLKIDKESKYNNNLLNLVSDLNNGTLLLVFLLLGFIITVGLIIFIIFRINKKNNAI